MSDEETNANLYALDDRATKVHRKIASAEVEETRARLAAQWGYAEPTTSTPRATTQYSTPNRRSTNVRDRIASIKRGGKARSASPLTGPSTTFTPPNTFTTTPSTFAFGAQQPQQQPTSGFGGSGGFTFGQQQPSEGNGMDRIEQNPAPGTASSFTFGQTQQQQQPSFNGFGQQNSNPFAGFGQQNAASTENAQATPSFSFGQSTQNSNTGNAPSNPFGGFGQQNQAPPNTSTSFTFGAQSQSNSPAPSNPFSGFNSQPQQNGTSTPSNTFAFGAQPSNNQPSANGSTTPSFGGFGASQPAQQSTNSLFAPQPSTEQKSPSPFQGGNSLFSKPAETPKADGWASFKSASPAAANGGETSGASVLSGWQKEQTSKPAFSFSQSQMPTGDADDDDAMVSPQKAAPVQPAASAFSGTSNLFGPSTPAAAAGNDLFSRISKPVESSTPNAADSTDNAATSKPSASGGDLFSRMTFPDKAKEPTVSATPAPKASNPFAGFSVAPPATAPAKNLFSGLNSTAGVPATPTPAAEKEPEAPSTVKAAQPPSAANLFSADASTPSAGSSLFAPKPAAEKLPEAPAAATHAPSFANSLFSSSTTKASAASLFTPATPKEAPSITTNTSQTPAPAQPTPGPAAKEPSSNFDPANASKLRKLNEGILQRLAKADPNADFSQIFKFYIQMAEAINDGSAQNKPNSSGVFAGQTPKPASTKNLFEQASSAALPSGKSDDATNKRRKSGETNGMDLTKSLFAPRPYDAETPKPAFTNGLFGRVPSTEPSKNHPAKRSIEDDDSAPATEKRRKSKDTVEYPKLPAGASDTAKLFEAALDKPADSGAAAKSLFTPKPASQVSSTMGETSKTSTFGGFKPSTASLFSPAKASNGAPASNSLFTPKPSADADKAKPAATAGFMPTFAAPPAGGSNFLSAFGQNATKEQDAARKKAMDEDFASEDDDPEEWKKQYEEKQAAKRKAIEDAAKSGGGFMMKAAVSTPAAKEPEKEGSAPEDNTWKQGTPIKFGVEASTPVAPLTAPPKGTGLFGSAAGSSLFANAGSKTPQPSSGSSLFSQTKQTQSNGASLFSFSKTTETTTTAGPAAQPNTEAATNGEAGEGGDDEAANDPQVEDMTALQPAEQEESDILYHIEKAKSYKFEQKLNADKPEWVYKALGPVWLLRNKSTGKTRLLQKVAPLGKAGMNFNVMPSAAMYSQSAKRVTASFIDHINEKEPKKPSQWFVQVGKEDDAKELARLLKEEAEKQ